jgi:large subunit ribosomal protein L4
MKYVVYNQQGKEIGQTLLPKEIFDVKINSDLIHQVAVSQMSNQRIVMAQTKDRGEVRGGGIKPWRQKGTGRARHGSRRSPLWRGGGVTFGPTKDRVFKKKINKKMKKKALFMVLSGKVKNNLLILLDKIKLEKSKTKEISEILGKLPCKEKSSLIVLPGMDKNLILAARNLQNAGIMQAKDLNTLYLLRFKYLVMPKEAIETIKETFLTELSRSESEVEEEDLSSSPTELSKQAKVKKSAKKDISSFDK